MLLLTYTRGEEKEIEKARSRMLNLVREKRNHRGEIQRKEDKGILMRKGSPYGITHDNLSVHIWYHPIKLNH